MTRGPSALLMCAELATRTPHPRLYTYMAVRIPFLATRLHAAVRPAARAGIAIPIAAAARLRTPLAIRPACTLVHKPAVPEDESLRGGEEPTVILTERAIKKLTSVAQSENNPDLALRVTVEPGGCHGYQYKLEITNEQDEDDFVFSENGVRLLVDSVSLALIRGSTIDYVTELIGSQFAIRDNPQAKGSGCGCGVSWEPAM